MLAGLPLALAALSVALLQRCCQVQVNALSATRVARGGEEEEEGSTLGMPALVVHENGRGGVPMKLVSAGTRRRATSQAAAAEAMFLTRCIAPGQSVRPQCHCERRVTNNNCGLNCWPNVWT